MVQDYYQNRADEFIARTLQIDMSALYVPFTSRLPEKAKVLDAGCGAGRDAKAFLDMGFDVCAFDASDKLVSFAATHTGLDVHHMTFDDVSWDKEFDGVWASASLLHVPYARFRLTLEKLLNALQPAGLVFLSVKYGECARKDGGRTFYDYTEDTMASELDGIRTIDGHEIWTSFSNLPAKRTEKWLYALVRKLG